MAFDAEAQKSSIRTTVSSCKFILNICLPFLTYFYLSYTIKGGIVSNFIDKTPNLKYFEIGDGSDLQDSEIEMIARRWPNLQTLRLLCDMPVSETACTAIKTHCRRLRTLEMSLPRIAFDVEYSFFMEIPSLRKIVNDHREFYREDFCNIGDYVKRHRIPYEEIGALQNVVQEYTVEELEEDSDEY